MKSFITIAVLSLFVSSVSFASGESKTNCARMQESESRSNPKANMESEKPVQKVKPSAVAG